MLRTRTDKIFAETEHFYDPVPVRDIYSINFKKTYIFEMNMMVNEYKRTKELNNIWAFNTFEEALHWLKGNPDIYSRDFAIATGKELIELLDFLGLWSK
jgi:hypothetical protein